MATKHHLRRWSLANWSSTRLSPPTGGRLFQRVDRLWKPEQSEQHDEHVHRAEAARSTSGSAPGYYRAPAAESDGRYRPEHVLQERAKSQRDGPPIEVAVSICYAKRRFRRPLQGCARSLQKKMAQIPDFLDVTSRSPYQDPQMTVDIDLEKAMVYGIAAGSGAQPALQCLRHASDWFDLCNNT